jgi:hypothetical protein
MPFDTGDLTARTYKAILVEAERFHHDLTLQFGLLSDECDDEATFIKMSQELVREMLTYDETELEGIFFGDPPVKKDFHFALNKILHNISKLTK